MLEHSTVFSHLVLHYGYVRYRANAPIAALYGQVRPTVFHALFPSFEKVFVAMNIYASRTAEVCVFRCLLVALG